MGEFDVAIFGAGIAGASVAYRLAEHARVVLVEREDQPGYHSTGRSAAMFIETYGPPGVRALTRASRAFYERPPAGFTAGPLLSPRGVLYLAEPGQQDLLIEREGLEPVSREAALAMVPCLRPERLAGALYERDAQDMDVHAMHQGFLRGFRERRGVLRTGMQVEKVAREGQGWALDFHEERLLVKSVVNAAGAWADELALLFGAQPVGLVPHRRTAFTFRAPQGVDVSRWPAVCGADESYYFKPDAGRLLGSPANADPTTPHDVRPEELDVALGIDRIQAVTTLAIRRPESTWAGLRSFVRDGEMVIGWDGACPDLFWVAAMGGYGIQSAAAYSEMAAALVLGRAVPAGLPAEALSPARLR
jgi:D-arginine dehydrogenase